MFTEKIIDWYKENKRELPWRETKNPYQIWLVEIILQQTRIEQGIEYFYKFIEKYPSVYELAKANEDELLILWQGLGYYTRDRNLLTTAKTIAHEYNGKFPNNKKELLKLKGIGDYTASAIASFAFNKPEVVMDGNIMRFIARYMGINEEINSSKGKKILGSILEELIDKQNPGLFNQAVMEFGAIYCKPGIPNCESCIFHSECRAFEVNEVKVIPKKTKKTKQKQRYFYFLIVKDHGNKTILLQKRLENDIWKNLYQFPLIETNKKTSIQELAKANIWKNLLGTKDYRIEKISSQMAHQLTHQKIMATFVHLSIKGGLEKNVRYFPINIQKLDNYALPRLIDRYLENIGL